MNVLLNKCTTLLNLLVKLNCILNMASFRQGFFFQLKNHKQIKWNASNPYPSPYPITSQLTLKWDHSFILNPSFSTGPQVMAMWPLRRWAAACSASCTGCLAFPSASHGSVRWARSSVGGPNASARCCYTEAFHQWVTNVCLVCLCVCLCVRMCLCVHVWVCMYVW